MTNFDFFLTEPKFASFAEVAVSAEKILQIDPAASVFMCRVAIGSGGCAAPIFGQQLRCESRKP